MGNEGKINAVMCLEQMVCRAQSGWIMEASHKVCFLGNLLGLLCSFCFTTVSSKDIYFFFLVGSSSFVRMDLKTSLRRERGVAFLPLIQIQLLRWLVTAARVTVELP